VKELQEQPPVRRSQEVARQVDKEAVKDAFYWEEKVADAMRRVTRRQAAKG